MNVAVVQGLLMLGLFSPFHLQVNAWDKGKQQQCVVVKSDISPASSAHQRLSNHCLGQSISKLAQC